MSNILSIDVEDYFMVSAFEGVVKREEWGSYESRIERSTYNLLEILDAQAQKISLPVCATFFCLGWVAERFPKLIKDIHSKGHEIASHGYDHRMVCDMSPEDFREDIRRSKHILESLTGEIVQGYRAPSYSITRRSLWALEILAEEGFSYDSSIFPVHHDRYGMPDAPRFPYAVAWDGNRGLEVKPLEADCWRRTLDGLRSAYLRDGRRIGGFLLEFPVSTMKFLGQNLPVGGGGYFRFFPEAFSFYALRRIERKEGIPVVFYIHPWEIDPAQPKMKAISAKSRFRHYFNMRKTEARFTKLLDNFSFTSFRNLLAERIGSEQSGAHKC